MKSGLQSIIRSYPQQFWLVSLIMMLAWLFHSMMWPYLLLYVSQKLNQPLTSVAGLMTLNAAVGMAATFLGGAVADKFGRKWVMVFSLIFGGFAWFFFRSAGTLSVFALLMALTGATTPLYRLAADAMVSDLIPSKRRLNAYSLLRMGNNFGVALGPAIGGFLVSSAYSLSFSVIGVGFVVIGGFVALLASETLPTIEKDVEQVREPVTSYRRIFRDRVFLMVLGAFTLNRICTSILWLLLAIYTKQNYGLSEKVFGFIPTTNAVMVIVFQMLVTRWISRRKPQSSMVLGALIYALAIFSVAFGQGFWGFWVCMVFATIGEMILVPTTTTFTSRLAPPEMRARYMSVYALSWGIGTGVGPLLAGLVSDTFSPRFMWYAAGLVGFLGALGFIRLSRLKNDTGLEYIPLEIK